MKIGTRVKLVDSDDIGIVADKSVFKNFCNMRGKEYIKWDKPRGERRITGESVPTKLLVKIKSAPTIGDTHVV